MTTATLYVLGKRETVSNDDFTAIVDRISGVHQTPFSNQTLDVLKRLSTKLLTDSFCREFPQLISLGYWLRPTAVSTLAQNFERFSKQGKCRYRVARGLAFHLPPANVDTLFAYSWTLSFLAGNVNVTRLPTDLNNVAAWLCNAIQESLDEGGLLDQHLFCTYDRSNDLVKSISRRSDLRVIWGGNQKVSEIAVHPIQPDGLSIGFPDRKSICCISANAYARSDENVKKDLAKRFYNDLYWFDQMGCGSPRLLVWLGDNTGLTEEFIHHLSEVIKEKQYAIPTAINIEKFVASNVMLVDGAAKHVSRHGSQLTLVETPILKASMLDESHGGGYLLQVAIGELQSLSEIRRKDLQTVTTFGFSMDEKLELAGIFNGNGGYRIVDVGQALQFDVIWDGVDMLEHFTRTIVIQDS